MPVGEGRSTFWAVDDLPWHDRFLAHVAGPFEIAERDASVGARLDRPDEIGMPDRIDVAGPLQRGLVGVHRARNVDSEHQLEIDGNGTGGRAALMSAARAGVRHKQNCNERDGFHETSPHQHGSMHSQAEDSATIAAN